MQINAINSVNFGRKQEIIDIPEGDYEVAQYNVSEDIDKFERAAELTDKLFNDNDQKGILAKGATVVGIGASSFAKGASLTAGIDKISGDRASEAVESGLKAGSKFIQKTATGLMESEGKRLSGVANFAGGVLSKLEEVARNAYKNASTATKKVIEEVADGDEIKQITKNIKTHSAGKGLAILGGVISAIALIPGLLKKDNNEDGIADFKQKSQNVYARNSKTMDTIGEKASLAVELMQLLT